MSRWQQDCASNALRNKIRRYRNKQKDVDPESDNMCEVNYL